ncbi:MAG: RDD family protein [Gammaproteobacteria bacterium]
MIVAGIGIELPLAGPGARSYAFIIDWHVRIGLALVWVVGAFLASRAWGGTDMPGKLLGLPAAFIYFAYHPAIELAMGGQTPGKRYAGVRVVARDGRPPSVTAILIRNAFRLIDSFPIVYTVGLLSTMLTRDSVRIGDLAAGTVLVNMPDTTPRAAARQPSGQTGPPVPDTELIGDLLERWPQLAPTVRRDLALRVLDGAGRPAVGGDGTGDEQLRTALKALLG